MRSIRLAVLVAPTLLAVLLLAPSSLAGTSLSRSTDLTLAPSAALAQTPVSFHRSDQLRRRRRPCLGRGG